MKPGRSTFWSNPTTQKVLISKVKIFLELDRQKNLLQEANHKLARINETLESKVQVRTAELKASIHELEIEAIKISLAEDKLLKAKKEWQDIFEAIGHMTLILDKDHHILAANKATLAQTGLALEEILGRKCHEIIHNDKTAVLGCPMKNMLDSQDYRVTQEEIMAFGKSYLVSCTPMFDDLGNLEKIIHISTDVTDLNQLKKELIQAHKNGSHRLPGRRNSP